jgi:hypothetical protein
LKNKKGRGQSRWDDDVKMCPCGLSPLVSGEAYGSETTVTVPKKVGKILD